MVEMSFNFFAYKYHDFWTSVPIKFFLKKFPTSVFGQDANKNFSWKKIIENITFIG